MCKHDGKTIEDPKRFDRVLIPYDSHVLLFADPSIVLQEADGTWKVHELRR
jgi:hypothetical protein